MSAEQEFFPHFGALEQLYDLMGLLAWKMDLGLSSSRTDETMINLN
jgi:hypothetical protein